MQLIFIYGPPAVGKLTVGRELRRLTGFKLFHNHLTVLVARSLFIGNQSKQEHVLYSELLKKMRLDALEVAAEANIDTIFTFAYSGEADDHFVEQIVERVRKHGGMVHFVQLHAPEEVLLKRVVEPSRREIAKLNDSKELQHLLASRDMSASIKHHISLKINTAESTAIEAAKQIVEHFKL